MAESLYFTASINRFFKLQERLKQEIALKNQAFRGGASISLRNPVASQINLARFLELRDEGMAALEAYKLASSTYLKIRQAIGAASATTSGMLAELDLLKAQETLLSTVIQTALDSAALSLDDLDAYKQDLLQCKESPANAFNPNTVVISLLDKPRREALQAEVERLRLQSFALQEKVAEANQARVSVAVTEAELKLLHRLIGQG